jgi:hypothetical protein
MKKFSMVLLIIVISFSCDMEKEKNQITTLTIKTSNPFLESYQMKSNNEIPEFTPVFRDNFYLELQDMDGEIVQDIYDVDCKIHRKWSEPNIEFTVNSGQYQLIGYSDNVQGVVNINMYVYSDTIILLDKNKEIDFQINSISSAYAILKNEFIAPNATSRDVIISLYYMENGVLKSLENNSTFENDPYYYSLYVNPYYQNYDSNNDIFVKPDVQIDSVLVTVPTTLGIKTINCGVPQKNTLYRIVIDYSSNGIEEGETLSILVSKGPTLPSIIEINITD